MKLIFNPVWIIVCISWKGKYSASSFDSYEEANETYNRWISMITGYDIVKPEKIVFVYGYGDKRKRKSLLQRLFI